MNELIVKEYLGNGIEFKVVNGAVYANATSMARIFDKEVRRWTALESTKRYIKALTEKTATDMTIVNQGGNPNEQGTWIHEKLVVKFAEWLDIEFEIWCDEQIATLIREGEVTLKPKSEEEMILELFPSTDSNLVMLTANTIRENKQLKVELKEERDFISHVVHNETYYITPTSMANKFGLSAVKLNKILEELNVQYKNGKKWCLKTGYYGIGDYTYFQRPDGEWIKGTSLHYSNDGERVIYKLLKANGYETSN